MPPPRLSTRQMEAFRAVMLSGSISGAARALGTSQPSLTRLVRRIEDIAGFALFDTVKGRLVPTEEARALLPGIERVQEQLGALGEAIERIAQRGRGPFRFGAAPSLTRQVVPDALVGFRRRFPGVAISFDSLPMPQVVDYLALGGGECFLSTVPVAHPAIACRPIWPGRLVCLLPAGHALAARPVLRLAEIAREPLVGGQPGTPPGEMLRALFAGIGAAPELRVSVRVPESAIGFVAHGHGVAILDEFTAMDAASDLVVARPLDLGPQFHVHLSRGRDLATSRYAAVLEAEVLAVLRRRGGEEGRKPGP